MWEPQSSVQRTKFGSLLKNFLEFLGYFFNFCQKDFLCLWELYSTWPVDQIDEKQCHKPFLAFSQKPLTFCGKNFDRDVKTAIYLSRKKDGFFKKFFSDLMDILLSTSVNKISVGLSKLYSTCLELHLDYKDFFVKQKNCNFFCILSGINFGTVDRKVSTGMSKLQSTCPDGQFEEFLRRTKSGKISRLFLDFAEFFFKICQ